MGKAFQRKGMACAKDQQQERLRALRSICQVFVWLVHTGRQWNPGSEQGK